MKKWKSFSVLGLVLSLFSIVFLLGSVYDFSLVPLGINSITINWYLYFVLAFSGLFFSSHGFGRSDKKGFALVCLVVSILLFVIPTAIWLVGSFIMGGSGIM